MRKLREQDEAPSAPSEWDFSAVPPDELEACLCYELARETEKFAGLSEAYLEHVKTGSEDRIAAHCALIQINIRCAYLLNSLGSHFDLLKTSWGNIPPGIRTTAAKAFANRAAFDQAKPGDARSYKFAMQGRFSNVRGLDERGEEIELKLPRGVKEWDGVSLHFQTGDELTLIHIDWTQPASVIKKQCKAWVAEKCTQRGAIVKDGRPRNSPKALLNGIGAMRLLAHHPFKAAIKIAEKNPSRRFQAECFYPYGGRVDNDGRPHGQSAWDTGIDTTVDFFHKMFPREEQEPRSWSLYQKRREK